MAPKTYHFLPLVRPILLIILLHFTTTSLAVSPPINISTADLCRDASDPAYCSSILPTQSANAYDSARQCLEDSLLQSHQFMNLIDQYLSQSPLHLSTSAVRALDDCTFLATRITYLIAKSWQAIAPLNATLTDKQADGLQTFLSAALTNQETCFDLIQAADAPPSVKDGVSVPSLNSTKLYSATLAVFTKLRNPEGNPKRWKLKGRRFPFMQGKSPLPTMSSIRNLVPNGFRVSGLATVSLDGSANFSSINAAIASAPISSDGTAGYFVIHVTAGVYAEYVSIPINKNYLMILGDGIGSTIITGNRSNADGWNSFDSATFAVESPNFIAVGLTIRNTAGPEKGQAVALLNRAHMSVFFKCSFEGYQNTLYAHSLRQFYRECDVYGTIDYIFGNAAVVLQNCNIYSRLPMNGQFNVITAQGRTDPNQNTGISLQNCRITAAADLASNDVVKTYLGRPWKEYSRVVYMQSVLDSLITPAGWIELSGDFALNTSYFGEFKNTGPRSSTFGRVAWPGFHVIDVPDADKFTVSSFLHGNDWLPQTGTPYNAGLF